MDTSGRFLSVKTVTAAAIFTFLIAVNIYSFTAGYTDKVSLYTPGPVNQTMYMPEFLEKGMYPDAFIRALVRDKKVMIYSDFIPYVNYPSHGRDHTEDVGDGEVFFSGEYYSDNNYGLLFKKYAKEIAIDPSIPSPEEAGRMIGDDEQQRYFSFLGYTNDMLRNSFLVNEDREYVNTYFHYAYFYYYVDEEAAKNRFRAYISPEDLSGEKEIVAIWDRNENLYLMSRGYYEDHILMT